MNILSLVEATSINAVARNVLEFYRSARELRSGSGDFPDIEASIVTFARQPESNQAPNDFINAARELTPNVEIISERRRFDRSVVGALQRIVERQRPDLIVTHSIKSHFLIWRSRVWRDFPWVAFHHGYTTTDLKMRTYNQLDRWSLPVADRIVTVCRAFAGELSIRSGVSIDRIHVQHNSIGPDPSVDPAEVEEVRKTLGIKPAERLILAVGRFSREKAQIDLLRAFRKLRDAYPEINARLVVVGDGPEREPLVKAAGSLGINQHVVFTGQVNNVGKYYAVADVLVNPSHSEGSPYVLLEAMAARLPIVATAVGGVAEMVDNNQTALLVPPNEPTALATAIARVLSDHQLAKSLAAQAHKIGHERFSPENYLRSLAQVYCDVISRRAARRV